MKTLMLISLFAVSLLALAYPIDEEGNRLFPADMPAFCDATGDVALFSYRHRNDVTEKQALEKVKQSWNDVWSKDPELKWHHYIDLQRIVRDAYRTQSNGEYRRECCTDESIQQHVYDEVIACLYEQQGHL